ncbi:MAG: proline--tRNA ligase [Candidatus Aenigmarchaeota archaeon]|nr:proline--tRNA ligase [Candidatus Aenigmarchaeota archaeon]
MSDQQGITVPKGKDFSEWYNEVTLKAGLADFSSVKGFMFIKPYGYGIWELIQAALDSLLKAQGHQNAYSPALIPERFLQREQEHVEGFSPELFVVTQAGTQPLEERLILRPTSETVVYDAYAKWIRSWRDLPLLYNYWNSVFRAEIKMTKLFLRTCEFLWQEGHTVHATEGEADREVRSILESYRTLMEDYLAIPVLTGRKSDKEKFAGAVYTTTLEALMPDGKALQMGTSHQLGQNFAKAFGITFLDQAQKRQHAWQTSWGVSTRTIGAVIMVHGDDRGLVLPPRIAPIQVVVVPIFQDASKDSVLKEAKHLQGKLEKLGIRVQLDDREGYSPGWKFNEWELKGVPVRLEIGPKDLEQQQAILVRRDSMQKQPVKWDALGTVVPALLEDIQAALFRKATSFLEANTRPAATLKELGRLAEKEKGFILAGWCGNKACEEQVKDQTGTDIRVIPFQPPAGACVVCGNSGQQACFARAY